MMHSDNEALALHGVKDYEASEYLGLEGESTSASTKRGLNFNPLRRLVQRNLLLILLPTLTAAGVTAAIVKLSPQSYTGSFQVLVEPMTSEGLLTQPSALTSESSPSAIGVDYSTLIRVLTSPSVLNDIIEKVKDQYPSADYNRFIKALEVSRVETNPAEKTKIIDVSYEDADPQQILFTLNELASGYLKFGLEDRKKEIGGGVTFIEQQLPSLQKRVDTLERQTQALLQQHNISDFESEGAELATQAREIESQKQEAERNLAAQKNLYNNLQSQLGQTPQEVLRVSSLSENPRYQALLSQLKELEARIAIESAQFQPEFPALQDLQEQRLNLMALLKQESQQLVGSSSVPQFQNSIQKSLSQQMIDTLNETQVLETRSAALTQAAAEIAQKTQQFPAIRRQYNDLQAQLEVARNTLKQLQLRRESLRVESAQKEVPWRLLSKPQLLKDEDGNLITSSRKGLQKLILGTLGGFLFGVGCAILREKRKDVFFSPEDLQEDVKVPVLGVFPFVEGGEQQRPPALLGLPETPEMLARTLPMAPLTMAAEGLYTNLRFLPLEPTVRSLVIASLGAKDGKTTVVTELAKAAASMGQRVLVVDTNMVMPQLHSRLEVPNFEGLIEVMTKGLDPNQYIQRSPYHHNLFVLTAGQVTTGSHKLVASQQMQHLMEQLHTMYDLVLYDTPQIQSYSDANFLALHVDGLLMVVSVGKTLRSRFLKVMKSMQNGRLPLLGLVANRANVKDSAPSDPTPEANSLERADEDEFDIFKVPAS